MALRTNIIMCIICVSYAYVFKCKNKTKRTQKPNVENYKNIKSDLTHNAGG